MLAILKHATPAALAEIQKEMDVRGTSEVFLLFSLGSQFDHLIKLILDALGVYCLVADPATVTAEDVRQVNPKGIILSGGPANVSEEAPPFDHEIFALGIPTLGICLGFQLWAHSVGMRVVAAPHREFGTHDFTTTSDEDQGLFAGITGIIPVLESHGDRVELGMVGAVTILGCTEHAPIAAAQFGHLYGVQFHPETNETRDGKQMFENFCFGICGARDRFPAEDIAARKVAELREQIAGKRILLAISGGSDSSVVAELLHCAAQGSDVLIRGVYILGIDREDDNAFVLRYFGNKPWIDLKIVDATEEYLEALRGKTTMREKRVAMKGVYQEVLTREVRAFAADAIAQGTLYTDLVESGEGHRTGARRAVIKSHHNVGLEFGVAEIRPLADCVKPGARNIGRALGVPEELLVRHPFPGPGLVVRIEGEVTAERLAMARAVDRIYVEELRKWELYHMVWQAGAVVTQSIHTCSEGDDAAEGTVIALWAVWSVDGFTATWAELPSAFIRRVSRRITNEVRGVGCVVQRVSDKPKATIEWG